MIKDSKIHICSLSSAEQQAYSLVPCALDPKQVNICLVIAAEWRPDTNIFVSFQLQLGMGKFGTLALKLKDIDNEAEVTENEKSCIFFLL